MDTSDKISEFIKNYPDWRGQRLQELREIINDAAPEAQEEFKWSCPVWAQNGLLCAINGFKDHVKINFLRGAHLPDQSLFNSGLDSKEHRSINLSETDKLDKAAITGIVKAAVAFNALKQ